MPKRKGRTFPLDELLVNQALAPDVRTARGLIMAGRVQVNGERTDKSRAPVALNANITVTPDRPFASRGGFKLAGALQQFNLSPSGLTAADVGASTGGFTDALLQAGAKRVYAIDVGYGELAWELRNDPRVVVMERTNARLLETLPEPVALVVIDVSFISLKLILPAVLRWTAPDASIVALIKPQFEAPQDAVDVGGIVRNVETHRLVLTEILESAAKLGLGLHGLTRSSITGAEGNVEFLAWWRQGKADTIQSAARIATILAPTA